MPNTGSVGIAGKITGNISKTENITGSLAKTGNVTGALSVPTSRISSGDYNELRNKPTINDVTIEGDKVSADYKLQHEMDTLSVQEIERILYIDD